MLKYLFRHLTFIFCSMLLILILMNIPYNLYVHFKGNAIITSDELNALINNNFLLGYEKDEYVLALDDGDEEKINEYSAKLKLFNLLNIKNLKVSESDDNVVSAGGDCIGISLQSHGVVVVGSNYIITKDGNENPFKDSGLKVGDVIIEINKKKINNIKDINAILETYKSNEFLTLTILRKSEELSLKIKPALDIQTNKYKLGLWIRDDALGVGTLTFVKNDKRFGSLGHAIIDADTGVKFDVNGGDIYNCNVIGVKRGAKGVPGELLGLFMQGEANKLGIVDKNSDNGVFGKFTNPDFQKKLKQYEIGGRMSAKPGKATILSCVSGTEVDEYDIEIIKTNYQSKANEKSMIIKITDKRLIEKTGGIVQGMSGSPIIQNNKIIGAVTHVFLNDPTKGFGLYLDWMLEE